MRKLLRGALQDPFQPAATAERQQRAVGQRSALHLRREPDLGPAARPLGDLRADAADRRVPDVLSSPSAPPNSTKASTSREWFRRSDRKANTRSGGWETTTRASITVWRFCPHVPPTEGTMTYQTAAIRRGEPELCCKQHYEWEGSNDSENPAHAPASACPRFRGSCGGECGRPDAPAAFRNSDG